MEFVWFLNGPAAKEMERNQRSFYLAEAETLQEFREFSLCSQTLHKLLRKQNMKQNTTVSVFVSNRSLRYMAYQQNTCTKTQHPLEYREHSTSVVTI